MLIDLINKYASAEANAGNWQGVVNVLTTPSIVVLNDSRWTLGTIQLELGVDTARTVASGMKAVGDVDPIVGSAYIAMSTVGMQLHTDDRQAMVDVVGQAAGWSSDLITSLKALGKKTVSPVEQAGIPAPTEAECQAAWESQELDQQWTTLQNEVIRPVEHDRALLVAALRQSANELEAG